MFGMKSSTLLLPLYLLTSLPLPCQTTQGNSIRGISFDAVRGVPLQNAQVTLTSFGRKEEVTVRSGGGGEFSFENLPAGSYIISVSHYSSSAADPESQLRSRLVVSLDGQHSIEGLKVSPPASYTIAGTVQNYEDNWPLSDAIVEAFSVHYVGGAKTYVARGQAVSDDLGRFRIRGLSSGTHYIRAWRPPASATVSGDGKAHNSRQVFETIYYPNARSIAEAQAIRVDRNAPSIEIDVRLRQIDAATVMGHVCTATEVDSRNIRLGLYQSGPPLGVGTSAVIGVEPRGDFLLSDLAPGSHLLCGSTNELPPLQLACARLDVAEGAKDRTELCLRQPGNVTGQVRLAATKDTHLPMDQFRIVLSPQDIGPIAFGSGGAYQLNSDGHFNAPTLMPGRYRISFDRLPGPWFAERITSANVDATIEGFQVAAQSTSQLEIVLSDRGGAVEGEILGDAIPITTQIVLVPEPAHRKNLQRYFSVGLERGRNYKIEGVPPGSYLAIAVDDLSSQEFLDSEWITRYESSGTSIVVQERERFRINLKLANSTQ